MSSVPLADRSHADRPSGAPKYVLAARSAVVAALLAGFVALVALPSYAGAFVLHIFVLTFLTAALAVSYRPLLLAGQVSIAHGTFYAIGAYTTAILVTDHGLAFWPALAAAGAASVVASLVIGFPSLRTAGAYFFLITFAFSVVATSLIENFSSLTGGFGGISGLAYPPGITSVEGFFYVALVACVLVALAFWMLDRARWGLELRALGSAPALAQATGISRFGTLLATFAVGALFAGMLGGLYASYIGFIAPQSFDLVLSVSILTAVIVGGTRFTWGPLLGAVIVTLVPQAFRWEGAVNAMFGAATVIAVMLLMRRGIATELTERIKRLLRLRSGPPARDAAPPAPRAQAAPREPGDAVLLRVAGLEKSFGGVHAVRGVEFALRERETLGLIGPNGSGKTTTFNLISGFTRSDKGTVELAGMPLGGVAPHRAVRHGLARSFQASTAFDELTVFENVLLAAAGAQPGGALRRALVPRTRDRRAIRAAWETLDLVGLADVASHEAGALPYGRRKLLGLAIGLATQPRVLCLDEPATGMTDAEIEELVRVLRVVRERRDIALVIIEHRLAVIRSLCDRVVALSSGAVLAEGTPREVLEQPEVVEAYLGKAPA